MTLIGAWVIAIFMDLDVTPAMEAPVKAQPDGSVAQVAAWPVYVPLIIVVAISGDSGTPSKKNDSTLCLVTGLPHPVGNRPPIRPMLSEAIRLSLRRCHGCFESSPCRP